MVLSCARPPSLFLTCVRGCCRYVFLRVSPDAVGLPDEVVRHGALKDQCQYTCNEAKLMSAWKERLASGESMMYRSVVSVSWYVVVASVSSYVDVARGGRGRRGGVHCRWYLGHDWFVRRCS